MLIFFQTLSTKGWQVDPARYELPGKDLVLHTARPVRKDRASLGSFLGQSMIGGTLRSATRYIRTRSPRSCSRIARKGSHRMWYVGLDWADTHHDVEVPYLAGKRVGVRRFAHSHAGLNELQAFLLGIAASPEDLACIVETKHGLLITFLLEAGIPVYPVNPRTANHLPKTAG